jgi:PAS domain S-box-containing protein
MEPTEQTRDILDLRETFQDAEAICHALRMGEVDAVVVGRTDEEKRVLLLSGAYARYRQLVEDMLQGAVTVSSSGEILFANHAFADIAGTALIDLFRSPLEKHVAPADRAKLQRLLSPHPGDRDVEIALVRPDGTRAHVRAGVVSASDDFVTLILTPVTVRDREEAEATIDAIDQGTVDAFVVGGKQVVMLDSAQAHYRLLVERMRQGAVTVQHNGTIAYANERFIATIGLPSGRVVGRPLGELVADADRAALQAMLAAGENATGELRLRCANGDRPIVLATMTSIDGHKLFLFTDLTEQKRHEAADERTRRFLGMLAHEFRNILAPIGNSTQILKRQAVDAEGQKAVEIIERQTERLLALVEDLRKVNPKE